MNSIITSADPSINTAEDSKSSESSSASKPLGIQRKTAPYENLKFQGKIAKFSKISPAAFSDADGRH